jgi:hypothetical protein
MGRFAEPVTLSASVGGFNLRIALAPIKELITNATDKAAIPANNWGKRGDEDESCIGCIYLILGKYEQVGEICPKQVYFRFRSKDATPIH